MKGRNIMTFYEELVMQTQMNFSKYYGMYASGKTPYILTEKKPLPLRMLRMARFPAGAHLYRSAGTGSTASPEWRREGI